MQQDVACSYPTFYPTPLQDLYSLSIVVRQYCSTARPSGASAPKAGGVFAEPQFPTFAFSSSNQFSTTFNLWTLASSIPLITRNRRPSRDTAYDGPPNRVRHPTDCPFISSCFPPPLARRQLPLITGRSGHAWGGLSPPRPNTLAGAPEPGLSARDTRSAR